MPKLWSQTIDAHRAAVHDAIMDTTATLVAESGLLSVTMSQIAEVTGIGRATLYKYFSDVEAILFAWHDRQITTHLSHLAEVRDRTSDGKRLEAVLEACALHFHESRGHHDSEFAAFIHKGERVAQAQLQLHGMIRDLLIEGAQAGHVRDDVAADELATYCLHALTAASSMVSKPAVRRLVAVTLAGLRTGRAAAELSDPLQETVRVPLAADDTDRHGYQGHPAGVHARPPHRGQRERKAQTRRLG